MTAIESVTLLMAKVEAIDLSTPPCMRHASILDITAVWNGIGPAWAPEWFRKALSTWLRSFQPAALVHDYSYSLIDRNQPFAEDQRQVEDLRFYENCSKCAAYEFTWLHPKRLLLELGALAAWRAVRRLGGASL